MRRRTRPRHSAHAAAAILALVSSYALADPRAKPDASATDLSEAQNVEYAPLYSPEAQALREYLNFDPARALSTMPATTLRAARNSSAGEFDWNRTDKSDGSSALSVKKPLPIEWDAKVGADFGFAPAPGTSHQPLPYGKDQNTGADSFRAAWANVKVPGGLASIDARIDPAKEQSKLGTTFSRSVPVGSDYSVTLLNSYALTETLGRTPSGSAITGVGTAPIAPAQVWSTDRMVKFNILPTGTTLAAGTTSSTVDNVTRNKISAEQKLFENFNVTTAVTDVGAQNPGKSISAGFKLKW